ncbi:MAG TPA: helix-turn-helix domain-containing protein [Candidatus Dormibacteraeota bacterium]
MDRDACLRGDAALRRAFEVLGKRWTGLLLGALSEGPLGFRTLAQATDGISDSMLADRLADLTQGGLVKRVVSEGPPVAVTYELTARGQGVLPALQHLSRWAEEHLGVAEPN